MTKSFKDFRSLGFRDKSADYDSDNIIVSIKDKHKREGKLSEKQNRDDTSAMLELRDIYDELHTLQKLFSHQKDTLDQMLEIYKRPAYAHVSENGQSILRNAQEKLHEYTQQVEEMIESATRTRTDVGSVNLLETRFANISSLRNFWTSSKDKLTWTKLAWLDTKRILQVSNPERSWSSR